MTKSTVFNLVTLAVVWMSVGASGLNTASWMADTTNIKSKTLHDITLPGTHDSGAYWLSSNLAPDATGETYEKLIEVAEKLGVPIEDIITPWAQSGDKTIYEQLVGGIRYIDLRACYSGDSASGWTTFHFETGHDIQDLLNDVKRFLTEQTGEIVVIETSHLGDASDAHIEELGKMLQDTLDDFLIPNNLDVLHTGIGDLVSDNHRALVTLSDSSTAEKYGLFDANLIDNSYADSDKLDTMISYNDGMVEDYNKYSFNDVMYKMSWTLTPAADCIVAGLLPWEPHSLIELADTANQNFKDWAEAKDAAGLKLGNIFIVDHFETSNIVSTLVGIVEE